jgi:hypothetical protein
MRPALLHNTEREVGRAVSGVRGSSPRRAELSDRATNRTPKSQCQTRFGHDGGAGQRVAGAGQAIRRARGVRSPWPESKCGFAIPWRTCRKAARKPFDPSVCTLPRKIARNFSSPSKSVLATRHHHRARRTPLRPFQLFQLRALQRPLILVLLAGRGWIVAWPYPELSDSFRCLLSPELEGVGGASPE